MFVKAREIFNYNNTKNYFVHKSIDKNNKEYFLTKTISVTSLAHIGLRFGDFLKIIIRHFKLYSLVSEIEQSTYIIQP